MFREGVKKICRYQIFRFNILFNLNDKSYHFLIITLISIKCVDRKKETRENFIQRYTFPPLGGMITYSTCVLYCNVLYCTVLYCTVLYCTVLYSSGLRSNFMFLLQRSETRSTQEREHHGYWNRVSMGP